VQSEGNQDILKILESIFRWIFILCLPVFLLATSLAWGFNSRWVFNYGFTKYHVSDTTGISDENLHKISNSWIRYINSGQEYWDIVIKQINDSFTLFTQDEQRHFKDVKALVWLDYKVWLVTLILCVGYIFYRFRQKNSTSYRRLAKDVITAAGISIGLILLLGAASFLDFDSLFLKMHYLLFSNDFWYAEGYMLLLFPGGFWYDAVFICIGLMVGLTLVTGGAGLLYIKLNGRIKH
jgi:integral membrane protein (TIGR01906 family)